MEKKTAGKEKPNLLKKRGRYIFDNETSWPDYHGNTEWNLRYNPDDITREDQLYLASVLSAYRYLIIMPEKSRQKRIKVLKRGTALLDGQRELMK